jgi:hypothetical protein
VEVSTKPGLPESWTSSAHEENILAFRIESWIFLHNSMSCPIYTDSDMIPTAHAISVDDIDMMNSSTPAQAHAKTNPKTPGGWPSINEGIPI